MRRHQQAERASGSLALGSCLALVGGALDAYTYCTRGGVFANSQTGNMALLAIGLAAGDLRGAPDYLIPIAAYALGALLAETGRVYWRGRGLPWQQMTLLTELLLVGVVAAIPAGLDMPANILVSMLCALQAQSFRKVRGVSFVSTTCSGNLRSAVELFYRYSRSREGPAGWGAAVYLSIILIFILGAMLGAFACAYLAQRAVLICALPLAGAFLLLCRAGQAPSRVP